MTYMSSYGFDVTDIVGGGSKPPQPWWKRQSVFDELWQIWRCINVANNRRPSGPSCHGSKTWKPFPNFIGCQLRWTCSTQSMSLRNRKLAATKLKGSRHVLTFLPPRILDSRYCPCWRCCQIKAALHGTHYLSNINVRGEHSSHLQERSAQFVQHIANMQLMGQRLRTNHCK